MSRIVRVILAVVILLVGLPAQQAMAAGPTGRCEDGRQSSGAIYRICMPQQERWNGDLVLYAHGYVAYNEPIAIPFDQLELPGGTSIPDIVNTLGFAFATTSYSTNGLAVREGIVDLRDLVRIFSTIHRQPRYVYLVGASEGGLITALAVEQFPRVFDGGLAVCGPVGDLRWQINYWGDFRAVFDYFFPGRLPGSPVNIPQGVIDNWDTIYRPRIRTAIWSDLDATSQLLRVTRAPIDTRYPASVETTILGLLWYNVFATNDGIAKLGGQPFDNADRVYRGSEDDLRLNQRVQRFRADRTALREIEAHYQTTGHLTSPLVTIHTTGDPVVPYWHEILYREKVSASGAGQLYINIPIIRYGHCNFRVAEVLFGFGLLVWKVTGQQLTGVESALLDADSRAAFLQPAGVRKTE